MRDLLANLRVCADEIGRSIEAHRGRGYSGLRETQYHLDVVADEVARRVLGGAGLRVVSEESGVTGSGPYTVVVDPIDGSTNCDRGVPFYTTSLAALRDGELVAGYVVNHATGTAYEAERGAGATRDGQAIGTSGCDRLGEAVVAFSGLPDHHAGWAQFRALGAASLEICLVADGSLDAYGVAQRSTLNPWDYLAGLLIAREAGAVDADYRGEELVTDGAVVRRPIIAATERLLGELVQIGPL
ncbi:MAG: inositol monophosphatase [Actinomycetales bacterium]|nr:inositol monophosphatase [Actinomycetales bacterium]